MNRDEFRKLDVANRLPTPNGVALKLLRLQRSETASAQEFAHVIKGDPALAGRVIGAANALGRHGSRPVVSTVEALVRIGTSAACRMALGFSVLSRNRTGPCTGFDYRRFWVSSVIMGITMQSLAERTRLVAPEEAFTVGLLADVGHLALATLFPDRYGKVYAETRNRAATAVVATERAAFATDHVELGEHMLAGWGFPDRLVEPVVAFGRDARDVLAPGSRQLLFAESLRFAQAAAASVLDPARAPEHGEDMLEIAGTLKLSADALASLSHEVATAWPVWAELLEVDAPGIGRISFLPTVLAAPADPAPEGAGLPPPAKLRALLVGPPGEVRDALAGALARLDVDCHAAADEEAAVPALLRVVPHLVLFEWHRDDGHGLVFCRTLRSTAIGRSAYVLAVAGGNAEQALIDAVDAGADDFLPWPIAPEVLAARLHAGCRIAGLQCELAQDRDELRQYAAEQAVVNRRLREASRTDPLTELPNRRYAMDQLDLEWEIAQRTGAPLAALMVDLDNFKRVNDNFGHAAGDEVLRDVAAKLRDAARAADTVCRIGGEEFLVICRGADKVAAQQCAERLRLAIGHDPIMVGTQPHTVTVSVGVAASHELDVRDARSLLESADRALYAAKREGRDRVAVAA
ncbi:MAG: diguanylate cyclase [Burkholderiales bacterium]